jgi:hypothetical protein
MSKWRSLLLKGHRAAAFGIVLSFLPNIQRLIWKEFSAPGGWYIHPYIKVLMINNTNTKIFPYWILSTFGTNLVACWEKSSIPTFCCRLLGVSRPWGWHIGTWDWFHAGSTLDASDIPLLLKNWCSKALTQRPQPLLSSLPR